jgi:hypothetical protein
MKRRPKRRVLRLDAMVAVGAGTADGVRRWAAALSRADIPTTTAECCEFDPHRPDYVELWVRRRDVEAAHSVLWGVRRRQRAESGTR